MTLMMLSLPSKLHRMRSSSGEADEEGVCAGACSRRIEGPIGLQGRLSHWVFAVISGCAEELGCSPVCDRGDDGAGALEGPAGGIWLLYAEVLGAEDGCAVLLGGLSEVLTNHHP